MAGPLLHSETFTMDGAKSYIQTSLPIAFRPTSFTVNGVQTALLTEFVDPIVAGRWFWNPGDKTVFEGGITPPAAGTVIAITYEASSSNIVSTVATSSVADLANVNDPQTSNIAVPPDSSYDYTPQQPTGIIQTVVDIPGVTNEASAASVAAGIARRASVVPIAISGSTIRPGLKIGQQITAYLDEYDASGEYVISSLSAKSEEADLGYGTCFRTSFEAVILEDAPDQSPEDTSTGGSTVTISSAYPIYPTQTMEKFKSATAIEPTPLQYETLTIVLGAGGALVGGVPLGNEYIVRHAGVLREFLAIAVTPPLNQTLVIDVLLNGVSIFGANKLEIASGSTDGIAITQFRGSAVLMKVRRLDIFTFSAVYRAGTGTLGAAQNVTVEGEWYY